MDDEISGSGYSRSDPDKCPDHIPLWVSDPGAVSFDASEVTFSFRLEPQPPREIWPGVWFSVDDNGFQIWDYE